MAEYPTLTKKDLAHFSGRSETSYRGECGQEFAQAILLFKIATCLTRLPDDEISQALAKNAILAYADYIILSRPYAEAAASPFSSESLGSYSYSKSAKAAANGEKTGIMWFDLAVDQMGVCNANASVAAFGGIEIFEHDGVFVDGHAAGVSRLLSPQDLDLSRQFGFDPAPLDGAY